MALAKLWRNSTLGEHRLSSDCIKTCFSTSIPDHSPIRESGSGTRTEAHTWKNGRTAFTVSVLPFLCSNAVERWNGKRFRSHFFTSTVCVTAYLLYIHQTAQEYSLLEMNDALGSYCQWDRLTSSLERLFLAPHILGYLGPSLSFLVMVLAPDAESNQGEVRDP